MSGLLRNITNVIWHAFDALYQEEKGYVNKSKLKVLTANIGTILDMYGLEKGLDHYKSSSNLNFESFRHYLLQEVFSSLSATLTMKELRNYEEKIDEICWLICRTKYTIKNRGCLNNTHLYKLFRIFCLLSDFIDNQFCEVKMHSSEAALVLQQFLTALGLDSEFEDKKLQDLNQYNSTLYFDEFLDLISFKNHLDYVESLQEIIEDMYQTYIKDIIKKGYILRRGYLLPTFKEYWFVLQPCELNYYKNHYEKDLCGTIALDHKFMVKPSMSSSAASGKSDKILKFILSSGERNFELATHDHRTRMQWITALQLAITYSTGREGFQRDLVSRRRIKRDSEMKNRKADEQQLRSTHMLEVEIAKTQLEKEKQARLAAEIQAKEFEAVAREDSRRVAELEDLKLTLEKLLKEETQAKKDEEIVRSLQARVLAEEWEKREELEKLQQEQKMLLEVERSKRIEFEQMQKMKENELNEAECKLKILEEERKKLDLELKQARFKIIRSEENKEDLEARMDAMLPILNSGTIRRTLSFVAPSRERPTTLEDLKKMTP